MFFLVLNLFYSFQRGSSDFIIEKTTLFQGSRGGPIFSREVPTFFEGCPNANFYKTRITCDFPGWVWTPYPHSGAANVCLLHGAEVGLQSVIVSIPGQTHLLFLTCKHHVLANLNYGLLNSVISDFEERSAWDGSVGPWVEGSVVCDSPEALCCIVCLVLVQPRKTGKCLHITEKLLTVHQLKIHKISYLFII